MNRIRMLQLLPIMQAFAEGKTVQILGSDAEWRDIEDPSWNGTQEYRVKPDPIRPDVTEAFALWNGIGDSVGSPYLYYNENDAIQSLAQYNNSGVLRKGTIIKFKRVFD